MNVSMLRRASLPTHLLLITAATSIAFIMATVQTAYAASADARQTDSGQTVACMLPGQIHTIAGHATMGARRPVQTTTADCRERGGEYAVDEHASTPMAVPHVASVDDGRLIDCLLPKQVRQLGEKARYTTARRPVRSTRSDCGTRGGDVITSAQARKAAHDYRASHPKPASSKKRS